MDEGQQQGDVVRPFGWAEIKDPFAAGFLEVFRAARDSAGAFGAWKVDQGSLTRDITVGQRSYDRAAEPSG
jgi:hypothetical protein